ncbi:hypothetical protein [Herminiimonas sp. CN]|uniref:hypothetical protein n=1 Tax=Herminiimonas sp. CN TaxID=1349818 RepID=UPI000474282D|nr:hypothetical protein [Herminiimonas sp. CN]
MGWSRDNSRQQTLALQVARPNPTRDDLRAAYERCVRDKENMPFDRALTVPSIALTLKNAARAAILKRGGA